MAGSVDVSRLATRPPGLIVLAASVARIPLINELVCLIAKFFWSYILNQTQNIPVRTPTSKVTKIQFNASRLRGSLRNTSVVLLVVPHPGPPKLTKVSHGGGTISKATETFRICIYQIYKPESTRVEKLSFGTYLLTFRHVWTRAYIFDICKYGMFRWLCLLSRLHGSLLSALGALDAGRQA